MRGHEGAIYIGQPISYFPTRAICIDRTIRWSLHKSIHIAVQHNVAMVCASIHIAPINTSGELFAIIYIGDSIRCPIVGAMHIDCDNMIVSIASIRIVRA